MFQTSMGLTHQIDHPKQKTETDFNARGKRPRKDESSITNIKQFSKVIKEDPSKESEKTKETAMQKITSREDFKNHQIMLSSFNCQSLQSIKDQQNSQEMPKRPKFLKTGDFYYRKKKEKEGKEKQKNQLFDGKQI